MCYNYAIKAAKQEIEERYNATFYYDEDDEPLFLDIPANGFTHLKMPVITNKEPDKIQLFHWGLIPFFAKDTDSAKQLANRHKKSEVQEDKIRNRFIESAVFVCRLVERMDK